MSDDRRIYDAGIARIEQKLVDMEVMIRERETACQAALSLRITALENDNKLYKQMWTMINTPVRAIGWSIVLVVAAALGVIGSMGGHRMWEKFFK